MSAPHERGDWSAADYDHNARFVSDLGAPVLALLGDIAGKDVLDLGCGDGALTEKLVAAGARVTGVDASADMLAAARARGLDVEAADGQALAFENAFDAVFSNAALHWMTRPDAVIDGVARALRPGGLFVAEFGGMGNVAAIRTAIIATLAHDHGIETTLHDVWYFPTAEEHGARLEAGGFAVEEIALIPRPTPLPTDMVGWLMTLAAPALGLLAPEARAAAAKRIAERAAPALQDAGGGWRADYVRLRFRARLARAEG
ncbi:MAG: class I SAM-dependent methyltransferase [Pseudomonadota bacterium]